MFQLGAQGMAESASKRRSVRKRAPSLKAELNENYLVKVTVTPVKTPGRKRNKERGVCMCHVWVRGGGVGWGEREKERERERDFSLYS